MSISNFFRRKNIFAKNILPLIFLFIIITFFITAFFNNLKIVNYKIESEKISSKVRLVLVTDLHSCKYGKKEEALLSEIYSADPDVILLAGDFFDDKLPPQNCIFFLQGIFDKYPVYYVTGNHEYWASKESFNQYMEILKEYGVVRLSGDIEELNIRGNKIALCGVDDPCGYWQDEENTFFNELDYVTKNLPSGIYTVLISHRPEFYDSYQNRGFDLITAGHAHGGQWRIPFILNGLYAPNQGFFPKYAGGLYEKLPAKMIVSRGLARESTRLPRLYNRPELVIIDIL